jgi:hypothetical protein
VTAVGSAVVRSTLVGSKVSAMVKGRGMIKTEESRHALDGERIPYTMRVEDRSRLRCRSGRCDLYRKLGGVKGSLTQP